MSAVREEVPAKSDLPLFYRQPELLTPQRHAQVNLQPSGKLLFAAQTSAVPITNTEFAPAMRSYPIVFSPDNCPLVVLGFEQRNLFLDAEGHWSSGHYVPAYVRRYPFVLIGSTDNEQLALGIDAASERVTTAEGAPLFEGDQPTKLTRDALQLCGAFHADHELTREFGKALVEQNLLIDHRAQALLPNGRQLTVQGFRVVDRARLLALPDTVAADWHRKGWLALLTLHLASLDRWSTLLERWPA